MSMANVFFSGVNGSAMDVRLTQTKQLPIKDYPRGRYLNRTDELLKSIPQRIPSKRK